jgi:precorrin-6B methylase 2
MFGLVLFALGLMQIVAVQKGVPMATTRDTLTTTDGAQTAPSPARIMELGLGFWGSKTLLSAVELGVFTELAGGPRDAADLAAALELHPRSARDFLDALVALGMLAREDGAYSNTPEGELFLDRNKPSYIGGMLEMANTRLYPFWGYLTDALRTGEPQNEARTGGDFFAALYADPERLRQFLHAMTGLSTGASIAIAERFPFERHESVLDIGCAEGGLLVHLALAHGHLRATGLDLPAVQAPFEQYVASFELGDRIAFVAGDAFKDALPAADVITLGHVLHDWGLEEKRQLLAKAYEALPSGGAVIVFESIIDDERREHALGLLMSLNMLIETPRGFDYTGADCQAWMREAGFAETYVERLEGPDSMVVGIK